MERLRAYSRQACGSVTSKAAQPFARDQTFRDNACRLLRGSRAIGGVSGAVRRKDQFATSDGVSSGRVMPDPFRLPMICAPIFVTGQPVWFDRITVPLALDGVKIMNEV
jgi:hypothetical protein